MRQISYQEWLHVNEQLLGMHQRTTKIEGILGSCSDDPYAMRAWKQLRKATSYLASAEAFAGVIAVDESTIPHHWSPEPTPCPFDSD